MAYTAFRAQVSSCHPTCFLQQNGGEGEAHLIQEEVWLLNLSQGVSKEAEHKFLHLEPVDSPQLLLGKEEVMEEATGDKPTLEPDSLAQPYPLVLKKELLELRKGHLAKLWPLSSPAGREGSVWQLADLINRQGAPG